VALIATSERRVDGAFGFRSGVALTKGRGPSARSWVGGLTPSAPWLTLKFTVIRGAFRAPSLAYRTIVHEVGPFH
jgi:hypothetical protein